MVGYLSHFMFGGAVAPPDMAAQYLMRVLPVMVIGLAIYYNRQLSEMIAMATVEV